MPKVNEDIIYDIDGLRKIAEERYQQEVAKYSVPLLDEEGNFTGQYYDRRLGAPQQPTPERLMLHLAYLHEKHPNLRPLRPGERIPQFNPVDPFESSGFFEAAKMTGQAAYQQSMTADIEKGIRQMFGADEEPNAFGLINPDKLAAWQPNMAENVAAGLGSFLMPADLATFIAGAGVGGVAAKGAMAGAKMAKFGEVATNLIGRAAASAGQLATYEGARGFFEGATERKPWDEVMDMAISGAGKGAVLGAGLGGVAGAMPGKIAGSRVLGAIASGSAEVAVLGSFSPIMEGRAPTGDDYLSAAGFIIGMKLGQGALKLTKAGFTRLQTKEADNLKDLVDDGNSPQEAFDIRAGQIIKENPDQFQGKTFEAVRKFAQDKKTGTVAKVKNFLSGNSLSAWRKEANVEVAVENLPKGLPGTIEVLPDGKRRIILNAAHPDHMAGTLFHELGHLRRMRLGQRQTTKAGERRPGLELDVEQESLKKLETIAGIKGKIGQRLAERRFYEGLTATPVEVAANEKSRLPQDARAVLDNYKGGAERFRISRGADKGTAVISALKTIKGKTIISVVDILGKNKIESLKRLYSDAIDKGERVYFSREAEKNSWFVDAIEANMVGKRVGGYLQASFMDRFLPVATGRSGGQTPFAQGRPPAGPAGLIPETTGFQRPTTYGEDFVTRKPLEPYTSPEQPLKKPKNMSEALSAVFQGKGYTRGRVVKKTKAPVDNIEAFTKAGSAVGATFAGMQEQAGGKPPLGSFTVKREGRETTFYADKPENVKAEYDRKMAEYDAKEKAATNKPPFRTLPKYLRDKAKMGEEFPGRNVREKMRWLGRKVSSLMPDVAKPAQFRFKEQEGQVGVRLVSQTDTEAGITFGSFIAEAERIGLSKIPRHGGEAWAEKIRRGELPEWKRFFENIARQIQQYRPGTKLRENYFPQKMKPDVITELLDNIAEIESRLKAMQDPETGRIKAVKEAEVVILNMVKEKGGALAALQKLSPTGKSPLDWLSSVRMEIMSEAADTPGFLRRRVIEFPEGKIPDELRPYYISDGRLVMINYLKGVSRWIAEQKHFGREYEKINDLISKLRFKNVREAELLSKVVTMWNGTYDQTHGLKGTLRKVVDFISGSNVAFKIGMGQATILNLGQVFASIIPDLGLWNTIRAGVRLIDPKYRNGFLLASGVDAKYLAHGIEAIAGHSFSGPMGQFADFMSKVSLFHGVNRGLQQLAGAAMNEALPRWYKAAQGTGKKAEYYRTRLKDFDIDYTKPLSEDKIKKAMYRFAMDSQLQKNVLADPVIFNEPWARPFVLFKRFGYRQASYIGQMLKREISRGNYMPVIRLAAGGMFASAGISFAINGIKSFLSGDPYYREDDSLYQKFVNDLQFIGAFGMVGDVMAIEKLSELPSTAKFLAVPVFLSDAEKVFDGFGSLFKDYEKYGDAWLATERNLYKIGSPLGTWPRQLMRRAKPEERDIDRYRAQKGEEKARIFKLLLQGEGKEASERVIAWNKNYPKSVHFRMHEVSPSALVDYLAKLAESYGKEKAGESSRAKKLAAQRRKELFERMKAVNQELKVYQQGIAGGR